MAVSVLGSFDEGRYQWDADRFISFTENATKTAMGGHIQSPDYDAAPTSPWDQLITEIILTGSPMATAYPLMEKTFGSTHVVFTTTSIGFMAMGKDLGVLFTQTIGFQSYTDGDGSGDYEGTTWMAWPVTSAGVVGAPRIVGIYETDTHPDVASPYYYGSPWTFTGYVTDDANTLRMLDDADIANDLIFAVTPSDIEITQAPTDWAAYIASGVTGAYGTYVYDNYGDGQECWYMGADQKTACQVLWNSVGARTVVAITPDDYSIGRTFDITRLGLKHAVVFAYIGLDTDGFDTDSPTWTDGSPGIFDLNDGTVTKVVPAWWDVSKTWWIPHFPLDDFGDVLVVVRMTAGGSGSSQFWLEDPYYSGNSWDVGAFTYPELTEQILNWTHFNSD